VLYPDLGTAYQALDDFPIKPSVVVNSAGGLQPYWLLTEPHQLDGSDLLDRWRTTWKNRAGNLADAVFNADRIMRLPGTINHKRGLVPMPVEIEEADDPPVRYQVNDLLAHLDETPTRKLPPASSNGDTANETANNGLSWVSQVIADYNARTTWADVLTGEFEYLETKDDVHYWHAVGAENDTGATTNANGTDRLIVFSHTARDRTGWRVHGSETTTTSYDRFSAAMQVAAAGDPIGDTDARTEFARQLQTAGYGLDDRASRVQAAFDGADNGVMTTCMSCDESFPLCNLAKHNYECSDGQRDLALPDRHRATDVGNAARLLELADGNMRYVHAWGKWIVYQHGRWVIDENDALVTEQAKKVARHLFKLAATITGDKDTRERVWKHAIRSEAAGAIAAMVRLARGAPGILVEHEQLDADPYLLNVRNGTIDLHTGRLRPHDPADLMTVQCPVNYDPAAPAPLWTACVERWQPDPAVRDYIQLRAGAGATGKPTETVDVDYGGGGNGKSKFWGAIQHVLGDYTVVPHKSLLVAQKHEQHATVVARLFRKRLAVASETKAADTLDDEQVKNLTGGDRLSGRRMREDPWEFQPTHTLVMFSNHKPTIQGRDEGIWRRLRLVPWEVTIPENEQDDDLAAKLALEGPGILAWVVDGARRFIAEGLVPPAAVRVATDRYRADEDTVGRFINDVLRIGDGFAHSSDIKAELDAWCDEQGIEPPRMNEITEQLKQLGCRDGGRRKIQGKRSTIWHGVSIAEIGAKTP
jgi:putative DNA primase/helicase